MGKYTELQKDVFSVFGTEEWKGEEVYTIPANFPCDRAEYIRVTIVPSSYSLNRLSVSGVLNIDIFTAYGQGPQRAYQIADMLDEYLVQKSLSGVPRVVTQFGKSSLSSMGVDSDNSALDRHLYTIPFNHLGVL